MVFILTKFCPVCGKEVEDNIKFCVRCGYNFYEKKEDIIRKSKDKKKNIIIVVLIILIIISGIYLISIL